MESAAKRFADKISIGHESGCWLWTGTLSGGYGNFAIGGGKTMKAHRWAYEHFLGPIPDAIEGQDSRGPCVLHSCDTPSCVNPAHLRLGTHQDNIDDKYARNRHGGPYGESVNTAKLREQDVREIRAMKDTVPVQDLAQRYGVHKATIRNLLNGNTWKTVE